MKKIVSVVIALMLCLCCLGAFAEEMPFDGTWIQFEDGFELCVPSDWVEIEVTDEMLEGGVFYVLASPDGARTMQIAWAETEATTIEEIQAGLATVYADAQVIESNGIQFVTYEDPNVDAAAVIALDAQGGGMYMFYFTPGSDQDYGPIALAIVSSIQNTAA